MISLYSACSSFRVVNFRMGEKNFWMNLETFLQKVINEVGPCNKIRM